jgi:hypothetical protein
VRAASPTEDTVSKYALMVMFLLSGCAASQLASLDAADAMGSHNRPHRVASLHHDPQWILEAIAARMGVELRSEIPLPAILFESRTPLQRMQAAAERQWGFRPEAFANAYAAAENRIYLIDNANFYERNKRTLDDALAHELVHYLQARYLKDRFKSEWSEVDAIALQTWFREEHMAPILTANAAESTGRLEARLSP